MKVENYTFSSKDDTQTTLHAVRWLPEKEPMAGLLIVHGMHEYIERYAPFAEYLAGKGFVVMGHDQIGHGDSVPSVEDRGIMKAKHAADVMVSDIYEHYRIARDQFCDIPFFILGHSMGSYLVRMFLSEKAELIGDLTGAVIMGTGTENSSVTAASKCFLRAVALIRGWDYKSGLVAKLRFGRSYRGFDLTGDDPSNNWLSKDEKLVKEAYADKKADFLFSLNAYRMLLDAVEYGNHAKNLDKVPKELPLLFVSGADDPVGGFGKGVREAARRFKKAGVKQITLHLYENDRHEILNETDKDVVYRDICRWMMEQAGRQGSPSKA